jgi:hypothetical protein
VDNGNAWVALAVWLTSRPLGEAQSKARQVRIDRMIFIFIADVPQPALTRSIKPPTAPGQ